MGSCDKEVFDSGRSVCSVDGWANDVEPWVQKVAARSGQRVDWHYSNGRANVLYIGDYQAVRRAVEALTSELIGRVIRIFPPDAPGLHRPRSAPLQDVGRRA